MMLTSFIPSLCPRKDAILAFRWVKLFEL
jgi:hypothetical protein